MAGLFVALLEFLHQFLYGQDAVEAVSVSAAEEEAFFPVAFGRFDEGFGDAIGGLRRFAGTEAGDTAFYWDARLPLQTLDER